jgi:hypothetical protein
MGLVRGLARGIAGLLVLGVGILILVPAGLVLAAISLPVLVVLSLAGVISAGALFSVSLRMIVAVVLGLAAVAAAIVFLGIAIPLGILFLKVMLFGLLFFWLARKLFGWQGPRSHGRQLVGLPVAEVAAPSERRKDKYDIAAERELDEELGI